MRMDELVFLVGTADVRSTRPFRPFTAFPAATQFFGVPNPVRFNLQRIYLFLVGYLPSSHTSLGGSSQPFRILFFDHTQG